MEYLKGALAFFLIVFLLFQGASNKLGANQYAGWEMQEYYEYANTCAHMGDDCVAVWPDSEDSE